MADAVPRTPEEDRPRLTREELAEIASRLEESWRWPNGIASKIEVERLIAMAQRTVAAEDWAEIVTRGKSLCGHWKCYTHTEDGGKHLDCWQCQAEQAERTLALIAGACDGPIIDHEQALSEIRRLLQEG